MKNLTEFDGVLIGLMLGMAICFLFWLAVQLIIACVEWAINKSDERNEYRHLQFDFTIIRNFFKTKTQC